ncbi:hypothetical protein ACF0H5_002373 [Mactra antiquata]
MVKAKKNVKILVRKVRQDKRHEMVITKRKAELLRKLRESLRKVQQSMMIVNQLKTQTEELHVCTCNHKESARSCEHRPSLHRFMKKFSEVSGMIYIIMREAADIREGINKLYGFTDPRSDEDRIG